MLDLRSHRVRPYEHSPVSRRPRRPASTLLSLQATASSKLQPVISAGATLGRRFCDGQATLSLRSPVRSRLRLFRTAHQRQHHEQQEQLVMEESKRTLEHEQYQVQAQIQDQEMTIIDTTVVDGDVEIELIQEPAILRLSPELLALIFHYVYVTPVVHRPDTVLLKEEDQQSLRQQEITPGGLSSSQSATSSPPPSSSFSFSSSSTSLAPPPSPHRGVTLSATTGTSTNEARPTATVITTTSDLDTTSSSARVTRRHRKKKSAVCIQNDLSSMLALCLTCRAFYPQAIRMLWRQRTLTSYDDLIEFYQAIDFSASLRKRQQKQRQDQQQQRLGMGYAVEEGLFTNEAALRIKSLTLLDMSLGSTFLPSLPSLSVSSTDSNQFFGGRTRSHSHADPLVGAGATLDFCQGIDLIPKHSTIDENSMIESFSKETTPASSSMTSSSSFSSTASPSSSAGPSTASFTTSKRRPRQKTTSIYSEMISPRLLNTIASHCFALVDLTICMDSNKSLAISGPSAAPSSPRTMVQPSIPFSIIAGALLSLKRLTLMGLICDSSQNKTGSELLVFAQKIHPLERISIRSCKGISLETYVELAVRSNRSLLSVDFEGLDFESSQQLTDMMSAYARYCKSLKSITLSCLHGLALDGVIMALAQHRATELQELHVLGHDSFQIPQQQQQHHHQGAPAPLVQQEPANNNNNNDHHNNINNVHVNQDGVQVPVTQMCHLADANIAFSNLALLHLRRLTLYCPGITDFALFQYLCNSPQLADLVLHEPTTILQHPQFQPFVQPYLAQSVPQEETGPIVATGLPQEQEDNSFGPPTQSLSLTQTPPTMASMTSAGFLELIFRHCPWLKYLFMKLSLETAQEWIVQPCFKQAGLDRCLYQYRTATGAPAVVMMWDARNKVVSRAST